MIVLNTIIERPYVFAFLLVFLFIGIRTKGIRFTMTFLLTGYFIAWLSEASSIRTGFPYGWYFYIYENLEGELLNWGVPVWDSLSYTFLCFAGMSLAEYVYKGSPFKLALLSAFFVLTLDIVIDPLAHLGDQWFLGKIYYYPNPGFYFDVPLSNFAGWFLVAFVIVGINIFLSPSPLSSPPSILGPLLYFGIFLFNFGITLWLNQWVLALFDLLWISIPLFFVFKRKIKNNLLKSETI